jgi:hypothetical protein
MTLKSQFSRVVAQQGGLTDTGWLVDASSLRFGTLCHFWFLFFLRPITLVGTISKLSGKGNDWPTGQDGTLVVLEWNCRSVVAAFVLASRFFV